MVKFHRGLDPHIQDAVATMTSGQPSSKIPFQWYNAAWTLDQNQATNKAFWLSYHVPTSNPIPTQSCPPIPNVICPSVNAHFHPAPGNPVPMDIDTTQRKTNPILTCYHYRKVRHKSLDCDLHFDIHTCTINEGHYTPPPPSSGFLEFRKQGIFPMSCLVYSWSIAGSCYCYY